MGKPNKMLGLGGRRRAKELLLHCIETGMIILVVVCHKSLKDLSIPNCKGVARGGPGVPMTPLCKALQYSVAKTP